MAKQVFIPGIGVLQDQSAGEELFLPGVGVFQEEVIQSVDCFVESLAITENAATINAGIESESFSLLTTEQTAEIVSQIETSATSLTITENQASINNDINCLTEQLVITANSANITGEIEALSEQLLIAENNAEIQAEIQSSVSPISILANAVNIDANMFLAVEPLVVSTLNCSIEEAVLSKKKSILISEKIATLDAELTPNFYPISVSTKKALIFPTREVFVNNYNLLISTNQSNIKSIKAIHKNFASDLSEFFNDDEFGERITHKGRSLTVMFFDTREEFENVYINHVYFTLPYYDAELMQRGDKIRRGDTEYMIKSISNSTSDSNIKTVELDYISKVVA